METANQHIWTFGEIGDQLDSVGHTLNGSCVPDEPQVAIKDSVFLMKGGRRVLPLYADCFDLGSAVQLADWWSQPISTKEGKPRQITINLALRTPENFDSSVVHELLEKTLYWETGDHWKFHFDKRRKLGRAAELQEYMWPESADEIALFSGGLDSAAGSCARLLEEPSKTLLLFGLIGHNSRLMNTQAEVYNRLERRFPRRVAWMPVNLPRRRMEPRKNNQLFRARGFAYLMAGAAAAGIYGKTFTHIYENAPGALNLPFRMSEVGAEDHARAVHPLSLFYMSQLISAIWGINFEFINPFMYSTKAEICSSLLDADLLNLVIQSVSCDRCGRDKFQCGCCSSCLGRREALAFLGIEDKTIYQTTFAKGEELARLRARSHFKHMNHQVSEWQKILGKLGAWDRLSRMYPSLLYDTVTRICRECRTNTQSMIDPLLGVLERYCYEWQTVAPNLQQNLRIYES